MWRILCIKLTRSTSGSLTAKLSQPSLTSSLVQLILLSLWKTIQGYQGGFVAQKVKLAASDQRGRLHHFDALDEGAEDTEDLLHSDTVNHRTNDHGRVSRVAAECKENSGKDGRFGGA